MKKGRKVECPKKTPDSETHGIGGCSRWGGTVVQTRYNRRYVH